MNHLTRMELGYVCVAGICLASHRHVRPVTPGRRLNEFSVETFGGPFGIGFVVEINALRACGEPPRLEDVEFRVSEARLLAQMAQPSFFQLLTTTSQPSFRSIFGDDLEPVGHHLAILPGQGKASLGCLLPGGVPVLEVNQWGNIRLLVNDTDGRYDLSVTDLRLYNLRDGSPNMAAIDEAQKKLTARTPLILSVGLTKPWAKPGDPQARHWAQVNNLHFQD